MPSNQDRIFQGKSTFPEHEEWFYRAREGVAGPYLRREDAVFALNRFIEYCQKNHLTGGRQAPGIDSANKKAPNVLAVAGRQPGAGGADGNLAARRAVRPDDRLGRAKRLHRAVRRDQHQAGQAEENAMLHNPRRAV